MQSLRPVLAGALIVGVLIVGGGLVRDDGPRARLVVEPPGRPLSSDDVVEALGTEPRRRTVIGTLVEVAASGMTLDSETGESIFVRFADETRICRRGCEATWRDLRAGDRVTASAVLGLGEPVRLADWVDANVTAGYGTVVGVEGDALSVVTGRPGRPAIVGVLLLEPYTRIEGPDGRSYEASAIEAGDSFYFTGSSETPGASEIWVYGFWGDF